MKLVSLNLKSFRQHRDTSVEFKPGLTGIVGTNGAGKTTMIEAIAFALYGSKAVRGKVDDLLTSGVRSASELKVIVTFENEGVVYRIERGIDDAQFFVAGEAGPSVRGNREVVTKVTSLLRMNFEEFSATFLTEQKGLEFLSGKKGATERERFIVRMMGYDRLERVQESLRNDRRDRKNAISGGEASLGLRTDLTVRIEREQQDLSLVEEKHEEAQRVLQKAEKEVEERKNIFQRLQVKFEEYTKIKQRVTDKTFQYQESVKRIALREMQIEKHKSLDGNIKEIYQQLISSLPDAKWPPVTEPLAISKALTSNIETLQKEKIKLTEECQVQKDRWREINLSSKNRLDSQLKLCENMRIKQDKFANLDESGACPTCAQELGSSFHSVKDHFEKERKKEELVLVELRNLYETVKLAPAEISSIEMQLAKLVDTESNLSRSAKLLLELESNLREAERVKIEQIAARAEMEALHKDVESEKKSLHDLLFSEDEYKQQRNQYDNTQRLLEVSRLQRVKLEGESNTKKALLERSKQELKEYDIKSRVLDESRKELILFDESDQILIDFRRFLNAQLRPRLAELASEFLSELTDGRYIAVDIASDFTPTVMEDGEAKSVISGGEEDLLNLCVRLALSNMLAERAGQTFSLLILDEVFGSLDENRRNNVLLLLDRLSTRFEQILVITHLEDIREGVQNLISVNYDDAKGEMHISDPLDFAEEDLVSNL